MARLKQSILAISGTLGDLVIYHHPQYGWLVRRRRGTVKPGEMNEACRKSNADTITANNYAGPIFAIMKPYTVRPDRQKLWNDLHRHIRKNMKANNGTFSHACMKDFVILPAQQLRSVMTVQPIITPDWQSKVVHVTLPNTTTTSFHPRLKVSGYDVTVVAAFYKSVTELIHTSARQLPTQPVRRKFTTKTLAFSIPPGTKSILLLMTCSGIISGAPSLARNTNGIAMVGAVMHPG